MFDGFVSIFIPNNIQLKNLPIEPNLFILLFHLLI